MSTSPRQAEGLASGRVLSSPSKVQTVKAKPVQREEWQHNIPIVSAEVRCAVPAGSDMQDADTPAADKPDADTQDAVCPQPLPAGPSPADTAHDCETPETAVPVEVQKFPLPTFTPSGSGFDRPASERLFRAKYLAQNACAQEAASSVVGTADLTTEVFTQLAADGRTEWWDGGTIIKAVKAAGQFDAVELDLAGTFFTEYSVSKETFDQDVMCHVFDAILAEPAVLGLVQHVEGHWVGYPRHALKEFKVCGKVIAHLKAGDDYPQTPVTVEEMRNVVLFHTRGCDVDSGDPHSTVVVFRAPPPTELGDESESGVQDGDTPATSTQRSPRDCFREYFTACVRAARKYYRRVQEEPALLQEEKQSDAAEQDEKQSESKKDQSEGKQGQESTEVPSDGAVANTFAVDEEVEGNWDDQGDWHRAAITLCKDGMYSLRYSDGATEDNVPASRIRKVDWIDEIPARLIWQNQLKQEIIPQTMLCFAKAPEPEGLKRFGRRLLFRKSSSKRTGSRGSVNRKKSKKIYKVWAGHTFKSPEQVCCLGPVSPLLHTGCIKHCCGHVCTCFAVCVNYQTRLDRSPGTA